MRSFTLVEVLIVLVLMTTVMLLVCMAVDIHLRQMTISRTEVEEAQAARAILNTIANDIRNTIVQLRQEQLEIDTQSLALAAQLSGLEIDASSIVPTESETATDEETVIYGQLPGIYGDATWLQIDTAKLPRGEMYGSRQVSNAGSQMSDRLSPSKTVLYFLADESDTKHAEKGLYRRQLDRQVTQYEINEGKETEYEQYDEVFAPEVVNIEFSYFEKTADSQTTSGTNSTETGTWLDYWDMDEMQTLPAAVQIILTIRRQSFGNSLVSSFSLSAVQEAETIIYSLVVPVEIEYPAEETATEEEASE